MVTDASAQVYTVVAVVLVVNLSVAYSSGLVVIYLDMSSPRLVPSPLFIFLDDRNPDQRNLRKIRVSRC